MTTLDSDDRPIYPSPDAPLDVARKLYKAFRTAADLRTLVCHRGDWMRWRGQQWDEWDTAHLRSTMYKELGGADYMRPIREKGVTVDYERTPWNPNRNKIANVMEAMAAVGHLSTTIDAPAWIGEHTTNNPAAQVISCTNGLLSLSTRKLTEHTPAFYNTVSVTFAFQADAPEPKAWLKFLASVWPDDPASIALLQEWVGYILSGSTGMQKILFGVGPTRCGKGTIARMLRKLIGPGNVTGPTMASLGTNFGLAPLMGRPLAIVPDARINGPAHTIVERLLSISGEDVLTIDRKFKDPWSGKLPSRVMVLSNEIPRFTDASGAIANRMLVLQMRNSFLGREDRTIDQRIGEELPGILNWALEGLDRLTSTGKFTVPAASSEATTMLMDLASPVSAFVRDSCALGTGMRVERDRLYIAWKSWCEDNGHEPGAKATFGRNLSAVVPDLGTAKPRINGIQVRCYTSIGLYPASPVSLSESAGQDIATEASAPVPSRELAQPAQAFLGDESGEVASPEAIKPEVSDSETSEAGGEPLKSQRESELCVDCGRAPARSDNGLCDFCAVKHRRQQTSEIHKPTLSAAKWFAERISKLREQNHSTAESAALYAEGEALGYRRQNLISAASLHPDIRVISRTSAGTTWSIDPAQQIAYKPVSEWINDYLSTLPADTREVNRATLRAAGEAAGYTWENVRSSARDHPRIESRPAHGDSKRDRVWHLKPAEEAS
ncbi:DNA primase family protein [Mycobacterium marinum]|uniref:DNA primase family protein n=1 Tax=Mycobacterium marinum TaxID=1781 RepID=UPI002358B67C|nr:phage/plasmid primase, P4 family [Mycobacterium marinum]MDC8973988.1 phage/plasmid primase, P4 family [Mycobacterium marinum]